MAAVVRTTAAVLATVALALPAGALAGGNKVHHGVNRDKLMSAAEQAVESRLAIQVTKVNRCSPALRKGKRNYSIWLCHWRAEGVGPGDVPYYCNGKARWRRRGDSWRIDPCQNKLRVQAPLSPTPGPHPLFGYNDNWTAFEGPRAFDVLAGTGAEVARTDLNWGYLEPARRERYWESFDRTYSLLLARGVRPLWVIVAAPCWAQGDPGRCANGHDERRPSPAHYDDLAATAAAVAARYPQSVGVEIWNEPNYPRFWGAWPQPDKYAEMLKKAADAIHAAAPGMPVVSAGLSPHADGDSDAMGFREFLEALYKRGAAQRADAIGLHPYPGVAPGDGYIDELRIQFGSVQQLQRRYNDTGAPLWVTEYGVSTTGRGAYGAQEQADALAALYTTMRRIGNIPLVVVHTFSDDPSLPDREGGFGVLSRDFAPKPAFCAMQKVRGLNC